MSRRRRNLKRASHARQQSYWDGKRWTNRKPAGGIDHIFEYAAVPNGVQGNGFVPAVWINGAARYSTHWPTGLAEWEAEDEARRQAKRRIMRYVGDWGIELKLRGKPSPRPNPKARSSTALRTAGAFAAGAAAMHVAHKTGLMNPRRRRRNAPRLSWIAHAAQGSYTAKPQHVAPIFIAREDRPHRRAYSDHKYAVYYPGAGPGGVALLLGTAPTTTKALQIAERARANPRRQRRNPSRARAMAGGQSLWGAIDQMKALTAINDHDGALLVLARDILRSSTFAKKARSIQAANARRGYMTPEVERRRVALMQRMLAQADRKFAPNVARAIHRSL